MHLLPENLGGGVCPLTLAYLIPQMTMLVLKVKILSREDCISSILTPKSRLSPVQV